VHISRQSGRQSRRAERGWPSPTAYQPANAPSGAQSSSRAPADGKLRPSRAGFQSHTATAPTPRCG
jgi:hypothetical protein